MKIVFLLIFLWQGDIQYEVDSHNNMKECQEHLAQDLAFIKKEAPDARILRAECFPVGREI